MDRRSTAGALLALAACIACVSAAPYSDSTALDLHESGVSSDGCYYNFQHYGEGDRIMTNEPCLNCTCHNRMLMCYLRVCPFTKPIGQDCTIEKRADQCCPIITCPDVPVDLLTSTSTTSPAEYGMTGVGHLDKYGCSINNKFYPEGAKVPPTPEKPCEHCYCIRNMTTCVMQECTLHVDGCTPIYNKEVCCPIRYSCDHNDDLSLMLDHTTTTEGTTPGFEWTTTVEPTASVDCLHGADVFSDGALIKTEKACEHCYCMKGDIVCVVQECGTPMENEGKNCTSLPPREGQCCPDTYICEGDSEVTTEPPRKISDQEGDYRVEIDQNEESTTEGSGYSSITDEPIRTTKDSSFTIKEIPEDDTSYTILNTVTDEPERTPEDNLSTIKEIPKEETTHPTLSLVTGEPETVTEDNLSTIKEGPKLTSQTTLSPETDGVEHVTEYKLPAITEVAKDEVSHTTFTEDNVPAITEVPKDEVSHTTLGLVTDGSEHVTEDNVPVITEVLKDEVSHTTLGSITDGSEYVTEDDVPAITEVSKDEVSYTTLGPVTDGSEHVTEDNVPAMTEVLKEEVSHTTLSSVTIGSEHVTEDNVPAITEVSKDVVSHTTLGPVTDESEHVTDDNAVAITEVSKDEVSHTTLVPVTDESEHVTEDNLPAITEVPKDEASHTTLGPVTDESKHVTEDKFTTITELPKDEGSHTTSGLVTDDSEHVTDNFPAITEGFKDETYHTTSGPVIDGSEHATENNLATIAEPTKEEASQMTLSPVTDSPVHATEINLSTIKEIAQGEISYTTLSTVTDDTEHAIQDNLSTIQEILKEETSSTTLSPVTDKAEQATENYLSTLKEISKGETSPTIMNTETYEPEHVTEDNLSTVKDIHKYETSHTTLSPVTEGFEHITESNLPIKTEVPKEEIVTDKPELATEDGLFTIKEIFEEETSHTTLSSLTKEYDHHTKDISTIKDGISYTTISSITNLPERTIEDNLPQTTLGMVSYEPERATEDNLSTIKHIPKKETAPTTFSSITDEPEHVTEDDYSHTTLKSVSYEPEHSTGDDIPAITEVPKEETSYTTLGFETDEHLQTTVENLSTISEISKEKQTTLTSLRDKEIETITPIINHDVDTMKQTTPTVIETTTHVEYQKPIEYTTISQDIYHSNITETTDNEYSTIKPNIHDDNKEIATSNDNVDTSTTMTGLVKEATTEYVPKPSVDDQDVNKESTSTSISEDDLTPKVTEKTTAITEHSEITSFDKNDQFTTESGLDKATTSSDNKGSDISVSTPVTDVYEYTSTPEGHAEQEKITTAGVPKDVTYDQTTSAVTGFDNEEKSTDATENIKSSTEIIEDENNKLTTLPSEETYTSKLPEISEDITKYQVTETSKATSEALLTDGEGITNLLIESSTTVSPADNEVYETHVPDAHIPEKDYDKKESTTIKSELDYTTNLTEEPDKGLNTVPVEPLDEEAGKITTETNQKDQKSSEATPTETLTEEQITEKEEKLDTTFTDIFISTTTAKSDEKIETGYTYTKDADATQYVPELTTTSLDVLKDISTQVPETHVTTDKTEDLENEIPGEYSPPIPSPGIIPGEGSCLVEAVTYSNNSIVPSTNKCQANCKCISSIVKCDPMHCSPPPEYMINCQPVYDAADSCCPAYVCDDSKETIPPQPHSQMSVTESSPTVDCGENCQTAKPKPVEEDEIVPEKHSELCSSGKCSSPSSDIPITEISPTTQHKDEDCEGTDCESKNFTPEISLTDMSTQPESSTKKVDVECTDDTCIVKHVTSDNVVAPADCLSGKCDTDIKLSEPPKDIKEDCVPGSECFKPSDKEISCVGDSCVENADVITENMLTYMPIEKNQTVDDYTTVSSKLEETLHTTIEPIEKILTTEELIQVTEHTMTTIEEVHKEENQPTQEISKMTTLPSAPIELESTTDTEVTILDEIVTVTPDVKTTIMALQSKPTESPYTSEYTQSEEENKTETTSKYDDTKEDKTQYPINVQSVTSEHMPTESNIFETSEPNKIVTEAFNDEITTAIPYKYSEATVQIATDITEKQVDVEKTETTTPYFVELVEHPHMIDENVEITTEDEYTAATTIKNIEDNKIEIKLTTVVPEVIYSTEPIDEGLNTIQPDYNADHTLDYELPSDKQSTTTEKDVIKYDEIVPTTSKDFSDSKPTAIPETTHAEDAETSITESKPHDYFTNQMPDTEHKIFDSDKETTPPTFNLSSENDIYSTIDVQEHYSTVSTLSDATATIQTIDIDRKSTPHETEFITSTSKLGSDIPAVTTHEVTTNLTPSDDEHVVTETATQKELELEHTSETIDEIQKKTETPIKLTTVDDSIIVDDEAENVTYHKDVTINVDTSTMKITPHELTTAAFDVGDHTTTKQISEHTDVNEVTINDDFEITSMKAYDETTKLTEASTTEVTLTSKLHEEEFNKDTTTVPPFVEKDSTSYDPHVIHEKTTTYNPKTDEIYHVTTNQDYSTTSKDVLEKSTTSIIPESQTTSPHSVYDETSDNVDYTKYPKEEDSKKVTTIEPHIEQETIADKDTSEVTNDIIYETTPTIKLSTYEEHTTTKEVIKETQPTTYIPYTETADDDLHAELTTHKTAEETTQKSSHEIETTIGIKEISTTEKVIDIIHEETTTIKPHIEFPSTEIEEINEAFTTFKPSTGILSDDITTKLHDDTPIEGTHTETSTPKLVTEHMAEPTPDDIITQGEIIKATSESTITLETETTIPIRDSNTEQPIEVSVDNASSETPEDTKITSHESTSDEDTAKHPTTIPSKYDYESSSSEVPSESSPTDIPKPLVTRKPEEDTSSSVDDSDQQNQEFPPSGTGGYGQEPDYGEDDQAFGPGTCRYGGKVYVSAQQIPRDDPCDFCFCFRSDIICLQQSCPPPIHGCHEEPIQGFCCPRYECPVSMGTSLNMTTTTTTTTTTLPPHFLPHAYKGAAQRKGCQIKGHSYQVGEVVRASSGPCLHCTCGGDGQMKCDPKACTPEPMLRQMIAAAVASKRRR